MRMFRKVLTAVEGLARFSGSGCRNIDTGGFFLPCRLSGFLGLTEGRSRVVRAGGSCADFGCRFWSRKLRFQGLIPRPRP